MLLDNDQVNVFFIRVKSISKYLARKRKRDGV